MRKPIHAALQSEFRPPACAETVLAFAESLARRATWLPAADQRDEYLSAVPKVLALVMRATCTLASLLRIQEPQDARLLAYADPVRCLRPEPRPKVLALAPHAACTLASLLRSQEPRNARLLASCRSCELLATRTLADCGLIRPQRNESRPVVTLTGPCMESVPGLKVILRLK